MTTAQLELATLPPGVAHASSPAPAGNFALAPDSGVARALELRVYWGDVLLSVDHLVKPRAVLIGESKRCDVFVCSDDLPAVEFPLIRYLDGEYVLTFFEGLAGELALGSRVMALGAVPGCIDDDLFSECRRLDLAAHARVIVNFGGLTLAMQFVPPPEKIREPTALDFQFLNILIIALFVMASAIISLSFYPYDIDQLSEVMLKTDSPMARTILEPPKLHEQVKVVAPKPAKPIGGGPTRHTHEGGGTPSSNQDVVAHTGVLQLLSHNPIFDGDAAFGEDVSAALGELHPQAPPGIGGLGMRLSGSFGDPGGKSIGISHEPGGPRRGPNYGGDVGSIGAKTQTEIRIDGAPPLVIGSLDPALIRAVIHDNKNAIKFCYERELQIQKTLSGTIRVQFVIGANGLVTTALVKETTMHNANVENCIIQKLETFVFPKPQGGGIVIVNYPFTFKSM